MKPLLLILLFALASCSHKVQRQGGYDYKYDSLQGVRFKKSMTPQHHRVLTIVLVMGVATIFVTPEQDNVVKKMINKQ